RTSAASSRRCDRARNSRRSQVPERAKAPDFIDFSPIISGMKLPPVVMRRRPPRLLALVGTALVSCSTFLSIGSAEEPAPLNADQAMARLLEGNRRFAAGNSTLNDRGVQRRLELTKTQKPFAVIVSCSDSRVGPEVVFDEGLGDIFVIRTAGEVLDAP